MVNYKAIERVAFLPALLVAALVLIFLAFQQLITLAVAVLATVLIAILLDPPPPRGSSVGRIPRPVGALIALLAGVAIFAVVLVLIIPPFVDETNNFVNAVPQIANDLQDTVCTTSPVQAAARSATARRSSRASTLGQAGEADRPAHLDRLRRGGRVRGVRADPDHRL